MFVTMDLEIADRLLPSICSIAIITWENGKIIDEFYTLIQPDCEVEDFFKDRHALTDEELSLAPTLPEKWIEIYDRLENKTVFCYRPNQIIKTLIERANVEKLNVPNFLYGSVESICKRTWKGLGDYSLQNITEILDVNKKHNDAYQDALSIGKLIYKSAEKLELNNTYELFKKIGFAGGYVKNSTKIPYRAVKSDDKTKYEAREWNDTNKRRKELQKMKNKKERKK